MQQAILNLDKTQQRPVVQLKNGVLALLDTGAFIPVWVGSKELLVRKFNAKFIKKSVPISGFGGKTSGDLYQVTIDVGILTFPDLPIIVNSELICPFNMILSATMFNGLIYEVNDITHHLNITIPDGESIVRNIKIKDKSGKLHVLANGNFGH